VIRNNQNDKEGAFSYLKLKTDQGLKLPIDTLKALTREL
jgi:hypothetical protein